MSRRTLFRGGLAVAAGAVVLGGATACDQGPTPEQITAETLLPLVGAATADASAARALAATERTYAAALGVIAEQRARHAELIREEIIRLDREVGTRAQSTSTSSTANPSAPATPAPATPTLDALRGRLRDSATQARGVCLGLDGYRAGLTGAVAASIVSMVEVQLT